jgi:hypothetical protein
MARSNGFAWDCNRYCLLWLNKNKMISRNQIKNISTCTMADSWNRRQKDRTIYSARNVTGQLSENRKRKEIMIKLLWTIRGTNLKVASSICKLIYENLKNVYASCAITTQKSKCLSLENHTFGTRWAHHTMPPVFTPSSFCLAMIWFDDILSPGSQKRARHQRTCKWIRLF